MGTGISAVLTGEVAQLVKSINYFDSAKSSTSRIARGSLHGKQPWLARMSRELSSQERAMTSERIWGIILPIPAGNPVIIHI